jgi:hypothetical protein
MIAILILAPIALLLVIAIVRHRLTRRSDLPTARQVREWRKQRTLMIAPRPNVRRNNGTNRAYLVNTQRGS